MYLQIEFDEQLMWGSLHNKEVGCTVALKIKCRYVKLWDWIQYQFKLVAMQNIDFAQPGLEIEEKLWDLTSKGKISQGIYFLNSLWLWGYR
jgi:hypothetical protein